MSTTNRYLNTRTVNTNYKCRNCNSMVLKYINTTSDELVGKFLCLCMDSNSNPTGPQFPLYEVE